MKIDADKVSQAVAEVHDAFRSAHLVVFGADEARLKAYYAQRARRFKAWDRSGPCLFRGCTKPSITRSHAVQRAKVLERIAEHGHVLTPQVDDKGQVGLARLGIKLASTFPGFCEEHETLFASFENTGLITDPRHLGLQMMRTVCREIARVRFGIDQLEAQLTAYRAARESYFANALLAADDKAKLHRLQVDGDDMEALIRGELKRQKRSLKTLTGTLFSEVMDYVEYGKSEPACTGVLLPGDDADLAPFELPVAMSGFAFVHYRSGERTLTAPCTITIVPQEGPTLISFGTERRHRKLLPLLTEPLGRIFNMINMVESWMVFGSDHWFITPSVWERIPAGRQAAICAGIGSREGSPGASIAPSILDDLRQFGLRTLAPMVASEPADSRAAGEAILAHERAKLTTA